MKSVIYAACLFVVLLGVTMIASGFTSKNAKEIMDNSSSAREALQNEQHKQAEQYMQKVSDKLEKLHGTLALLEDHVYLEMMQVAAESAIHFAAGQKKEDALAQVESVYYLAQRLHEHSNLSWKNIF